MARVLGAFMLLAACAAHAQNPVQEVQQAAPHLVAFAGSPLNFQSLVQGLAQGRPVQLTTAYANGTAEVATFTPAGPLSAASIVNALDQARLQLAGLGLARPNATQLATALVGGTLAQPNVQLGGTIATHPGSPALQTTLVAVGAPPSASAGGSQPAAVVVPQQPISPESAAGIPPSMTPGLSTAPSPFVTPSPAPITVAPPASPGASFYVPPANVPGASSGARY